MDQWYEVFDKVTGEVVSVGTVVADPLPAHLEKREIETPSPERAAPEPISQIEFLRLLTPAERMAVKATRATNPIVDDLMYMMELAQVVHLDHADTVMGINYLEQIGKIGAGRAAQILAGQAPA